MGLLSSERRPLLIRSVPAIVLAAALSLVPLAGSAASTVSSPVWSASYTSTFDQPSSAEPAGLLSDVVGFGPKSALAVGYRYASEEEGWYIPVVEHWNGTAWTAWAHQPKVNPEKNGFTIFGVAGTSTSNVWFVTSGNSRNNGNGNGLARWNGSTWTTVTQAGLPPRWNGSLLISAQHVWLVGDDETDARPFIATYTKAGKTHEWVTTRYASSGSFTAGSIRTAKDAWAVGSTTPLFGSGQPIVEHWTGSAWHRTPTPAISGQLTGIAATSATDALAVGYSGTGATATPFALHWDGSTWTQTTLPTTSGSLNAVAASGGGYWAAGSDPASSTSARYFRYDDGSWTTATGPDRDFTGETAQSTTVTALASVPGTARTFAVGYHSPNDCNGNDDCANDVAGALIIDQNGS
jgi:hypothetical protein